ncbi:DEAD/DEAH box helicase, partial [Candidatus Woesearchaeota archaeon]|nr:DEAD/DEAH box helicase [Candidatus Woesearchaeota archaeon]
MEFKGFTLDDFQEEAVKAIEDNQSVVVSAATGTGKTLIADYVIHKHIHDAKIIYTAPIKALSNQKYKDFKTDYGAEKVGIMTGDVVHNPTAPILVMTTEIYRNMLLSKDQLVNDVSYVIFDEIHYMNDPERGTVWEESVIFSPKHIRFLCLSATIPNADEFARWIQTIKEHTVAVVHHAERAVPLTHMVFEEQHGLMTAKDLKELTDIPDINKARGGRRGRRERGRNKFSKPASPGEVIKEV